MMSKDEKDKAKKDQKNGASRAPFFFFFLFSLFCTQVVGDPNKNIVVWIGLEVRGGGEGRFIISRLPLELWFGE